MIYKIIEKNEYGTKVKNTTGLWDCDLCERDKASCEIGIAMCNFKEYYLHDKEAAKLETKLTPETFTINDMYVESKLLFDCQDELKSSQKELIDLQIENKQLKERIESINEYLDKCFAKTDNLYEANAYQNVKEFIKNQK